MTDPTLDAIAALRADVRDRFDSLGRRLEDTVTRREHDAEVRRLDGAVAATRAENTATRAELNRHKAQVADNLSALQDALSEGDERVAAELAADRKQRGAEIAKAAADRKADRRWMVGAVLAAVGVAVPIAAFVRDVFGA